MLESPKAPIAAATEQNDRARVALSNDRDPTRYRSIPIFDDAVPPISPSEKARAAIV